MARDKTTKERAVEAAAKHAERGKAFAKHALQLISGFKRELTQLAQNHRPLRSIGELLDDKVEWLLAEDENFTAAAAELWQTEQDSRRVRDTAAMSCRDEDIGPVYPG